MLVQSTRNHEDAFFLQSNEMEGLALPVKETYFQFTTIKVVSLK